MKNLATPSDIVNCAVVDCSPTSTATLGSAYDEDALASGATLALLQQDAGSDPGFAQMDLADLYAALDAAGLAADTTTLAAIYAALDAAGLAADTTTLADIIRCARRRRPRPPTPPPWPTSTALDSPPSPSTPPPWASSSTTWRRTIRVP